MGAIKSIQKSSLKRPGLILWFLLSLGFAYLEGSRAIDTGSWLDYFGTVLMLFLSYYFLKQMVVNRKYVNK